jgi:hypothetical protein
MSEIKSVVTDMAAQLKKNLTLGEHGIIEVAPGAFEATLEGSNLTPDIYNSVQKHNSNLVAAFSLAVGQMGLASMKKDKKLEQVSAELPVLKDTIGVSFQRSKEQQTAPGSGEFVSKYGVTSARYVVNAAGNRGEYKKVRNHLAELAMETLK